MGKMRIFVEFIRFLAQNKRWWLLPMVITLALLGALVFFTQSSAVVPFIYTLF
jgi:hypothetical protein